MESQQRLIEGVTRLRQRISEDFSLARHPEAERAEIYERILSTVISGTLTRLAEQLSPDAEKNLEEINSDPGRNEDQKNNAILLVVISASKDFEKILGEEYERFHGLALEQAKEKREQSFESSESSAEAVGELVDVADDALGTLGINVPGLSIVGGYVDLFYDPARFRRTPYERQKRFMKQLVSLIGKALVLAWVGLLFFTIADALERRHFIDPLPAIVKGVVPAWYANQGVGHQLITLVAAAAVIALVLVLVTALAARVGSSERFTPLFEVNMNVTDEELVSKALLVALRPSFPNGMPEESLMGSCRIVYRGIYRSAGKSNQEDLKTIDELLQAGKEIALVAFLKSKVRSYRDLMRAEVKSFASNTNSVMSGIA